MTYRKRVYSGICVCGHSHMSHHGALVCNPDIAKIESRIPGTCLAYGNNEREGLGPDGEDHCFHYVDILITKATHRCIVCQALWKLIPPDEVVPYALWSVITPEIMGKCCDNVDMGDQVEAIDELSKIIL